MAKGKKSLRGKGSYAVYKTNSQYNKNKVVDLQRHIAANPNDAVASAALKPAATKKSSRWGYKAKSGAVRQDRELAQMKAKVRGMENVLKTVRDQFALVIGGEIIKTEQKKRKA